MEPSDDLVGAFATAAPHALVAVSPGGDIVWANGAAERLFGWSRADLAGRHVDALLCGWTPSEARDCGVDLRARRKDGTGFTAEVTGNPVESPVGTLHVVAVRDVTEARRTERRLRAVMASAPDAILGVDGSGCVELLNEQAERLFGWTAEELLGRPVETLVPADAVTAHARHRATYMGRPTPRPMGGSVQLSARRKDGTTFPAEISLSAVVDDPGSVLVLAAVRDVTDRMELEAERRRQALEAQRERAHRLEGLGQLAGGVAHDFNNLLGVILNFATLITRRITDPTAVADLAEIRSAAERGAALTRQLLAFARQDVSQPQPIEVNAVLRESASMLHRTLGERVELRLDLAPGGITARADPNQLEEVVLNLALNARDAMPGNGVLTIATRPAPASAGPDPVNGAAAADVVVQVADTGEGMDPEVLARAFEPFFTTKGRGQGTGLGLATVYGVVRHWGGDVSIDSEVGQGTTVTVLLRGAEKPASRPARLRGPAAGAGERILLVEDEPTLLAATARLLSDHGYEVLVASDGLEALERFDAEVGAVDVVVTDIAMPRMRGDELARALEERAAPVRVILMTGYDSGEILTANRPLAKPVSEDELLRVIREVLDA